jgi:hypothetical protein
MAGQPYCRYCGKPIPKRTHTVYFVASEEEKSRHSAWATWYSYVVGSPIDKQEAQLLTNGKIVSIKRGQSINGRIDRNVIGTVTTWDGETYQDKFFCKGSHAQDFAYAVLRTEKYQNVGMPAWIKVVGG